MRKEIVICDRCDSRIEHPHVDLVTVRVSRGDEIMVRDLCPVCGNAVRSLLHRSRSGDPRQETELEGDLQRAISDAREIANRGIERYAEGAGPHELVETLRDVSSAARR